MGLGSRMLQMASAEPHTPLQPAVTEPLALEGNRIPGSRIKEKRARVGRSTISCALWSFLFFSGASARNDCQ